MRPAAAMWLQTPNDRGHGAEGVQVSEQQSVYKPKRRNQPAAPEPGTKPGSASKQGRILANRRVYSV